MQKENLFSIEKLPVTPIFYIFKGVSGAGCSTAINQSCEQGLVLLSPPEFTTRPLRPGEKRGHRHHSISTLQLDKVRHQVAVLEPSYGNEYGFFKPAIKKIQRMLELHNVVVDSATPPQEWKQVLGDEYPVASLFFAPKSPLTAIERITLRAHQQGDSKVKEYLVRRAQDNSQVIQGIVDFDFWIDTTDFSTVFPSVKSMIETLSFGKETDGAMPINIHDNAEAVESLISEYQTVDATDYARYLLGMQ